MACPAPLAPARPAPGRFDVARAMFVLVIAVLGVTPVDPALAAAPAADDNVTAFLARAFPVPPPASTLWLTPELKRQARAAAGDTPDGARLRYWRNGERTAWVIDRVGKEAPITFGVIVEHDTVVTVDVLTYREHRGQEIRAPRWLAQFAGIHATHDGLDRHVDNITGATLSVRASIYVARLALFCHRVVMAGTVR